MVAIIKWNKYVPESRECSEDEQDDFILCERYPNAKCADPCDPEYEHDFRRVDVCYFAELREGGSGHR